MTKREVWQACQSDPDLAELVRQLGERFGLQAIRVRTGEGLYEWRADER